MKCSFAVRMTDTAIPFKYVGSYRHCFSAAIAASTRSGWPETTLISSTVPCSVNVASSTTVPLTRAVDASFGYTGGTIERTRGSCTTPPTRTGLAGATGFGGGGGGGGGGTGARSAVFAAPFEARIPDKTPPTYPPGIPPGTPPMTPGGGSIGASMIFAISRGTVVGATSVAGVTGRTAGRTVLGTATAGSAAGGGGGGGGGGPIGATSVIKSSSRSETLCGSSRGIRTTIVINSPWKITELTTDGFLYLSFSGNVAGKSLKMIASDPPIT